MSDAASADPLAPTLPGLRLIKRIGQGGFGSVWLAAEEQSRTYRAVKIVHRDPADGSRGYEKELSGLQRYLEQIPAGDPRQLALLPLDGPGRPPRFYAELPDGTGFYYLMELADDVRQGDPSAAGFQPESYEPKTLKWVWSEARALGQPPMTPREAVRLGVQLLEGVSGLHAYGVIHRDIKPANVIYIRGWPKLADIGLVTSSDRTRSFAGTEGYYPEARSGTRSADLYAVGKVLYEMATGRDRCEYPTPSTQEYPAYEAGLLRELERGVVDRACRPDGPQPYANAEAMLRDLRVIEAGQSAVALQKLERRLKLARRVALVAVPAAVIALALAWREMVQRQKIQSKEAEKSLALYQRDLERAAINVERPRFGLARQAVADAKAMQNLSGIEIALLERQVRGDPSILLSTQGAAVDGLWFDPTSSRLAVTRVDRRAEVYRIPADGRGPVSAPVVLGPDSVSVLAGFLGADRVVGTFAPGNSNRDRPLQVWNAATGLRESATLPGRYLPAGVLSDGATVAYVDGRDLARLWYWNPGASQAPRSVPWGQPEGDGRVVSGDRLWNLDAAGRRLLLSFATGREDARRSWLFFAAIGGSNSAPLTFSQPISSQAISRDGTRAAYAEPTYGALVLGAFAEKQGGGFRPVAQRSLGEIRALAFSSDGLGLVSGGEDERIRWHSVNSPTLEVSREFHGQGGFISALGFSPDGRWLASGDRLGEVRVWPLAGEVRDPEVGVWPGFKDTVSPSSLVASPDRRFLAVSATTNAIAVVDLQTMERTQTLQGISVPLAWNSEGGSLWGLNPEGKLVRCSLVSGAMTQELFGSVFREASPSVFAVAAPGGRGFLAFAQTNVVFWSCSDRPQRVAEWTGSQAVHSSTPMDVAFTPDGSRAFSLSRDELVCWDTATGRTNWIAELSVGQQWYSGYALAYLASSNECVVGTEEGVLWRCSAADGGHRAVVPNPLNSTYALTVSPDGRRLLAAGANGRFAIFRIPGLEPLVSFVHRGLRRPGDTHEHTLKRLLAMPSGESVFGLTEDGLLVRW